MKETIKASIGGYVFTLDKDAYDTLNMYLDNIRLHFENKTDGEEIISDIEYRMCELLQMKVKKTNSIVTINDAESIIKIMGNPIDFEDEEATENKTIENRSQPIKKKLYRDKDNGILGGVCSGLGQYFHLDPVLVRLGFVISVILGEVINSKVGALIVLGYIILWIATPAAKTIMQKLAMSGQDPTIESIESGTGKIKRQKGNLLGGILIKIIKVLCSIPLLITGISLIIVTVILFFFSYVFGLPSIKELIEILGVNTININMALILGWVMPAIILMHLAIKLITRITRKDLIIIGAYIIVWLISLTYIAKESYIYGREYKNKALIIEKVNTKENIDTLYLEIDSSYKEGEPFGPKLQLYRLTEKPESWFLLPEIEIRKDSIYKKIEVEIEKTAFSRKLSDAEERVQTSTLDYSITDSTFTMKPQVYSKKNIWNRELFKITIYCPLDKEVIFKEPIQKWMNMDKYADKRRQSDYVFTFSID